MKESDCTIVGASFAGLACAAALALRRRSCRLAQRAELTAGGIHNALKHGLAAGHAIADYLSGKREDPSGWFVSAYPTFRTKRLLRFLFDRFQSDVLFNLLLNTRVMRTAASIVYFHHKGVFDPGLASEDAPTFRDNDAARRDRSSPWLSAVRL